VLTNLKLRTLTSVTKIALRIPDPNFSIPDPGFKRSEIRIFYPLRVKIDRIPDQDPQLSLPVLDISNSVLNSQVCELSHAISETPGPRIRMMKNMDLEQYGTELISTAWDRAVLRIRIWDPQHRQCGYCKIRYRTFFLYSNIQIWRYRTFFLYSPRVFLSNMTVPYLFSLFAVLRIRGPVPFWPLVPGPGRVKNQNPDPQHWLVVRSDRYDFCELPYIFLLKLLNSTTLLNVQYGSVGYGTVPYPTVPHCTVPYRTD
jgi:hypothetical protein